MATRSSHRRRWSIQFSLRSLLLAMLVLGCGLGWSVNEVRRARRQQEAVAHIRSVRGHAVYDYHLASNPSNTSNPPPGPRWVRDFVGDDFLCHVQRVSIHLARDQDLESLRRLPTVNDLRLNTRFVTDDGIVHLRGLKRLQRLDLWCNQVTDEGVRCLRELYNLRELNLGGTQVTDAGLLHLHRLQNLRVLKLRNTRVTGAGVRRMQSVLPNCAVLGVDDAGLTSPNHKWVIQD